MRGSFSRRQFLSQCLATPLFLNLCESAVANINNEQVCYIAAAQSRLGEHTLQCFNIHNTLIAEHEIASRGHGFAFSQRGHIAAIARRPADFCLILNQMGRKYIEFSAQQGRHFYGHAAYDHTGDYLYLTENDFENVRGAIGVYDTRDNYAKVDEFESYGIGPHMIQLDRSGKQLIIANGGIETHPGMGRKKLNLPTMDPSLTFVDKNTGELIRKAQLPAQYHKNSIRHFSFAADDTVYLGLQNEGDQQTDALLAQLRPTSATIERLNLPDSLTNQLDNYVGDLCFDSSQTLLIASSPYGNCLLLLNTNTGESSSLSFDDVCGLSSTDMPNQFLVSSGLGLIRLLDLSAGVDSPHIEILEDLSSELAWDNHLSRI